MSMFSWSQSSSSDGTSVVSNKFWIYWAVTIPLTLATIIIWRLWWLWQERSYQKEVEEAVGDGKDKVDDMAPLRHDSWSHMYGQNPSKKKSKPRRMTTTSDVDQSSVI